MTHPIMSTFAENTSVSVERSLAEIKGTLARYGAQHFAYAERPGTALVEFIVKERRVRFVVPLPGRDEKRFFTSPRGRSRRSPTQAFAAWEQACRQRWRALCLAIKAKLEAAESGISDFESEFLSFIVDPVTGKTIGELARPQLAALYSEGVGQLRLTCE